MRSLTLLLILLGVLSDAGLVPEPVPLAEGDLCVRDGCGRNGNATLGSGMAASFYIDDFFVGDELNFNVSYIACRGPGLCTGLQALFLDASNFKRFQKGIDFSATPWSVLHSNNSEFLSGLADFKGLDKVTGLTMVLRNLSGATVDLEWALWYKITPCLQFAGQYLWAMMVGPIGLGFCLLGCLAFRSARAKRGGRVEGLLPPVAEDSDMDDDVLDVTCCRGCTGRKERTSTQQVDGARMPALQLCGGFPAFLYENPKHEWSRWWRSQIIFMWPWNPYDEETIPNFYFRLLFMFTVLSFNLAVLTLWSGVFASSNTEVVNLLGLPNILQKYIGSTLLQNLFGLISKTAFSFACFNSFLADDAVIEDGALGGSWAQATNAQRTKSIGAMTILVALAVLYVYLGLVMYELLIDYRCSVLINGVLYPFFINELLRSLFKFLFIPIPVFYSLLRRFGCEPLQVEGKVPVSGSNPSYDALCEEML